MHASTSVSRLAATISARLASGITSCITSSIGVPVLVLAFATALALGTGACRSTPTPEPTPPTAPEPTAIDDQSLATTTPDPRANAGATAGATAISTVISAQTIPAPTEPSPETTSPAATTATTAATVTPSSAEGEGPYAVIGVAPDDTLNVRAAPGSTSTVLGALPPHATGLTITQLGAAPDGGTWARVAGGAADGWVNRRFLANQRGTPPAGVAERAAAAVHALGEADYTALAALVHPELGLRFSPYAFVSTDHVVIDAADVAGLGSDPTVRVWGELQAVGGPIHGTFADYAADFVHDADYPAAPFIGFDERIGVGTTLDNAADFFPGAAVVEYHFDGFDPAAAGFDWVSLRLVFVQHGGQWMLAGIVHDEWTT